MKSTLFTFALSAIITLVSCNLKSEDFQSKHTDTIKEFLTPIDLSTSGFTDFLRNNYNNPAYAHDFLPNNFDHLVQFLEHGFNSHQSRSYEQQVIRLFANKLKTAS